MAIVSTFSVEKKMEPNLPRDSFVAGAAVRSTTGQCHFEREGPRGDNLEDRNYLVHVRALGKGSTGRGQHMAKGLAERGGASVIWLEKSIRMESSLERSLFASPNIAVVNVY